MSSKYEISIDNLQNHPAPKIDGKWQKELTRIGGLNDYGKPKLKLIWCPDEERPAYGEMRKTYLAVVATRMKHWKESRFDGTIIYHPPSSKPPIALPDSLVVPEYEKSDIAKQRWAITEWWAPELVVPDWENQRYIMRDGEKVDVLGPAPTEGQYRLIEIIQTEDGKYREPCDADIEGIRKRIWLRDQEKKEHGNREVQFDQKAIAELAGEYTDTINKKKEALADNLEERLKESIRPHLDKLVKNPGKHW